MKEKEEKRASVTEWPCAHLSHLPYQAIAQFQHNKAKLQTGIDIDIDYCLDTIKLSDLRSGIDFYSACGYRADWRYMTQAFIKTYFPIKL